MSTRCHIGFYRDSEEIDLREFEALIYRHSDGYPGTVDGKECGVLPEIVPFLKKFPRPGDTEYQAARLLQWLCNAFDAEMGEVERDLDHLGPYVGVLGYGICCDFHGDHDYYYAVYPNRLEVYECGYDAPPEDWKKIKTIGR